LRLALQAQPSILYAEKAAVVPTMSKMRLIMPRCCLVRVTEDSSAAFWHRSALRIVTKL